MAKRKPKSDIVDGKTYFLEVTTIDHEGNCLATVECDGVSHHNLIGTNWREFIDSFNVINTKSKA
jgi:hypothetical protein